MREDLYRLCPSYDGAVHLMACGIAEENFYPPRTSRSTTPLVTSYGRISPEKGFDLFLDAARIVTEKRRMQGLTPVTWLLFGKTDDAIEERRRYSDRLKRLSWCCDAVDLRIGSKGVWGRGRIDLLDRSWIAVVPSRYEPYGLVTAEAMARGLPVVATTTAGSRELLWKDGEGKSEYGLIIKASAESLADAVQRLLENPVLARRMGRKSARKARRQHHATKYARDTVCVYQRVFK